MSDNVNNPQHYQFSNGAQVIDITENLNFNRGNVVKYVARAGRKDESPELEDLKKAKFYLDREIERLEAALTPTWSLEGISELLGQFWGSRAFYTGWVSPEPRDLKFEVRVGQDSDPARVWDSIEEVPVYVKVEDKEGDFWRYNEDNLDLEIFDPDEDEWNAWDFDDSLEVNDFAPFKEVIE